MPWGSCSNLVSDTTSIVPTLYISGRQCGHWPFAQQCLQQSLFLDVAVCISFDPKKQQAVGTQLASNKHELDHWVLPHPSGSEFFRQSMQPCGSVMFCGICTFGLNHVHTPIHFGRSLYLETDHLPATWFLIFWKQNFGVTSGKSIVFPTFWRLDTHPHRQQPSRLRLVYQVVKSPASFLKRHAIDSVPKKWAQFCTLNLLKREKPFVFLGIIILNLIVLTRLITNVTLVSDTEWFIIFIN